MERSEKQEEILQPLYPPDEIGWDLIMKKKPFVGRAMSASVSRPTGQVVRMANELFPIFEAEIARQGYRVVACYVVFRCRLDCKENISIAGRFESLAVTEAWMRVVWAYNEIRYFLWSFTMDLAPIVPNPFPKSL